MIPRDRPQLLFPGLQLRAILRFYSPHLSTVLPGHASWGWCSSRWGSCHSSGRYKSKALAVSIRCWFCCLAESKKAGGLAASTYVSKDVFKSLWLQSQLVAVQDHCSRPPVKQCQVETWGWSYCGASSQGNSYWSHRNRTTELWSHQQHATPT